MMSGEAGNIPGLDSILRGEIMRKDALVNQLLNQNKEVQKEINTIALVFLYYQTLLWGGRCALHTFLIGWSGVGMCGLNIATLGFSVC